MHLRSRRVSGAADREQPCGLVVMDGWRRELFAFWVFGRKRMNRRRGVLGARGRGGGSCRASARTLGHTNECYWGPPRVILLFLERSFEPPAQFMLAQP